MPRPRQPRPTPDLLTQLPMRLTQPTFWHTVRFPGLDWFEARFSGEHAVAAHRLTDVIFPALQAQAQAAADATDWTQESGERLVYTMATAEALHQAVRAFGAGPPVPNAWPWDHPEVALRTAYFFVRLMEPNVVPDVYIPAGEPEDEPATGTGLLIGQLYFCLAAYDAAKAEVERRVGEHPEVSAAWEVVRQRNPASPGITARAEPARDHDGYFGNLFAGRGTAGGKLLGRMFKRHLAEAHGVPATREGLEGLLWSQFLVTLRDQWDRDELSDFGLLAHALDGDLKYLGWDIYQDLVDEARREEDRPAKEDVNLPRRPVKPSGLVACPRCGHEALPPYVCPACGVGVPRGA